MYKSALPKQIFNEAEFFRARRVKDGSRIFEEK